MAARGNFADGMAALAASADAVVAKAQIQAVGGQPATRPAWDGEAGDVVKKRLQGSIIYMNDDSFGYIPVASGAGILKTSSGASDADRVTKIKVSRDGSESGTFLDKDQLAAIAKSVWVGATTVSGEAGTAAANLRVGNVPASIRPAVVSTGRFTEAIVTCSGVDGDPVMCQELVARRITNGGARQFC